VTLLLVDTADTDQCEYSTSADIVYTEYEKRQAASGTVEILEIYDLDGTSL